MFNDILLWGKGGRGCSGMNSYGKKGRKVTVTLWVTNLS